ncbi:V-type ATP synthase subunit B [Entomospira entomophila]|uniref:V-type ATP synthase subunit B n=1 Tax=Entomospira entomophila TaxID=2719988 RepID=UPI001BAE9BCC|nr:V-type ATP synthase subunit B [Entomospira entomophilus]WDI35994.1 V-type ATP synthase subunit B [Entomospira entomophilus]
MSNIPTNEKAVLSKREYVGISAINGPLMYIKNTHSIGYQELVECIDKDGNVRLGNVLDTSKDVVVVQLFESTTGLNLPQTRVKFQGHPLMLGVSETMLGRVFDGLGRPIDGGADIIATKELNVNGLAMNPASRLYPKNFIQTGISSIDGMNTLIRGQKLPIFSGNGMPHERLAAQIARQAKITGGDGTEEFCVVFAAMGVKSDVAQYFTKTFEESGVLSNVALFLSLADDPSVERTITPRVALTLAEHLAFDCDKHVLVIMIDMANYCESLREISTMRSEIPSRKGYPGYLYSDLAELYERAGMLKGRKGSITQIPILTMPNDDISHPIPDLTGYITEGQIVFDRSLHAQGVYPPIASLSSLSRLMKDGIGEGLTRADHPHLSAQLFAAYSYVKEVRNLASVIGEDELTDLDKDYMAFGESFEKEFLAQSFTEERTITETLALGWKLVSLLPKEELTRLTEEEIEEYYGK